MLDIFISTIRISQLTQISMISDNNNNNSSDTPAYGAQDVQNYTTDSGTTEPPGDVDYIVANRTLYGIGMKRFKSNDSMNLTFHELIKLRPYISQCFLADGSNNTINFELKAAIGRSTNNYENLETEAQIGMINQSMQYDITGGTDGKFDIDAISVYYISVESITLLNHQHLHQHKFQL